METKTLTTIVILVVLTLAGAMYFQSSMTTKEPIESDDDLIFCTADAFQCPDGSFVGRTGPDCEFVCP